MSHALQPRNPRVLTLGGKKPLGGVSELGRNVLMAQQKRRFDDHPRIKLYGGQLDESKS